jgi:hypothetical protein
MTEGIVAQLYREMKAKMPEATPEEISAAVGCAIDWILG